MARAGSHGEGRQESLELRTPPPVPWVRCQKSRLSSCNCWSRRARLLRLPVGMASGSPNARPPPGWPARGIPAPAWAPGPAPSGMPAGLGNPRSRPAVPALPDSGCSSGSFLRLPRRKPQHPAGLAGRPLRRAGQASSNSAQRSSRRSSSCCRLSRRARSGAVWAAGCW